LPTREYDVEVVALIHFRHLHLGLALDPAQRWSASVPAEQRPPISHITSSAALRASTAFILTSLARSGPPNSHCYLHHAAEPHCAHPLVLPPDPSSQPSQPAPLRPKTGDVMCDFMAGGKAL
jgi:hypothetical protein